MAKSGKKNGAGNKTTPHASPARPQKQSNQSGFDDEVNVQENLIILQEDMTALREELTASKNQLEIASLRNIELEDKLDLEKIARIKATAETKERDATIATMKEQFTTDSTAYIEHDVIKENFLAEIADLKAKIAAAEKTREAREQEVNSLIEVYQNQVKETFNENIQLKEDLAKSLTTRSDMFEAAVKERTKELATQIENQLSNVQELNDLITSIKNEKSAVEKQIEVLQKEFANTTKLNNEYSEAIVDLKNELDAIRQEIQANEKIIEDQKTTISDLKNEYSKVAGLESEIATQKTTIAQLSGKFVDTPIYKDLHNQIHQLRDELEGKNTELADLQKVIIAKDYDIKSLTDKNANLIDERPYPGMRKSLSDSTHQALNAIDSLKARLSGKTPETGNDQAIKAIIAILEHGLEADDPQDYFDSNKAELKKQVHALRGIKSLMNTVVNAIMTVISLLPVIGITAMWLTGTSFEANKQKDGTYYSFGMWGAAQLAEVDIHQVTQAMSVKLGG